MSTIAVLGAYGTFGARVCRELARRGHRLILGGRDVQRGFDLARTLDGGPHEVVRADLGDLESCRRAVRGASVVAVCAGPFATLGTEAARAAIDAGAHYVDIADDRDYIRRLGALDAEFTRVGRCAAYGCSSLPAVSSALALSLLDGSEPPSSARVTLFIGNDNPKGGASIGAMVGRLGRSVPAPGGARRTFGDGARIVFPPPIGPRTAYTFDAPEHDLFPALLGVTSVDVRVGFELPVVNAGLHLLARLPVRWGGQTARLLTALAALAPRMGSSAGAVLVELFWSDGRRRARALIATEEGQRIAALPCAIVAHLLATEPPPISGVRPPMDVVSSSTLLAELQTAGLRVAEG
jgi:Saccharopine dehydrogenase NADP binding domain